MKYIPGAHVAGNDWKDDETRCAFFAAENLMELSM
jgi:hypothetical protein